VVGNVTTVLPYSANRSGPPQVSKEGGIQVFRGHFRGVWDANGVNRAPKGASEVRLNAITGEVLGVER
jgi:hypothetical protein